MFPAPFVSNRGQSEKYFKNKLDIELLGTFTNSLSFVLI